LIAGIVPPPDVNIASRMIAIVLWNRTRPRRSMSSGTTVVENDDLTILRFADL
jgi:hypothetical protein